MLQRLPFQKFHDDEGLAFVFADVVDRADVGVVEGRSGARLALEPLQGLMILCQFLGQELERHEAAELGVLGLVDHAHAPATQLLQNAIVRNGLANHARNQPLHAILGCVCS